MSSTRTAVDTLTDEVTLDDITADTVAEITELFHVNAWDRGTRRGDAHSTR